MKLRLALVLIAIGVFAMGCQKRSDDSRTEDAAREVDARPGMIPAPVDSLAPGPWRWVATVTPVERIISPDPDHYTIEFRADSVLAVLIDCNRGSGTYHVDGKSIRIGPLATTRMMCPPGSLDTVFAQQLDAARNWFMQGDTLMFDLFADAGTMRFVR